MDFFAEDYDETTLFYTMTRHINNKDLLVLMKLDIFSLIKERHTSC